MSINQYMAQHKKTYLLIGIISLILSIICWVFILGTGPAVSNGIITISEYTKRWWVFSILAIIFFPVSVFSFAKFVSRTVKSIKRGIVLILIAITIGLCLLASIMISARILDNAIRGIDESSALLYIAILIVCGLIIGFCMVSQSENKRATIHIERDDITLANDTNQTINTKKETQYSYLEEYKAKMKEGQK